jgi:trehalose-phosphatase
MHHLFHPWNRVAHCFASSPAIALFLDFDGTLAPLRPRPEDVWLDDAARRTLSRLARSPRFRVWIVTGRRRADVRARVGVRGIRYLGLHGWEGRDATPIPPEAREAVACARGWLAALLVGAPGVWLEDKGLTLAIHYQNAAVESVRQARKFVEAVLAPFTGSLQLIRGKKVWELAPRELGDKGVAVQSELSAMGPRAMPVYVGDDTMDEPAFLALDRGITIRVGDVRRTNAHYRLSSVGQVHQFLEKLEREFA